jgi:hypothetical protein
LDSDGFATGSLIIDGSDLLIKDSRSGVKEDKWQKSLPLDLTIEALGPAY